MNSLYTYNLPPEAIASTPASPRDSAKLMVFHIASNTIHLDTVRNLHKYLPPQSLLVMNHSKVLPCRVHAHSSKGPLELLVMTNSWKPTDTILHASCNKKLHPGETVDLGEGKILTVLRSEEKVFEFKANFSLKKLPQVLARLGEMALPPYIQNCPLTESERRKKYQTILADKPGSVAAPTAALHFTPRVLQSIKKHGIQEVPVHLHVGLGTFGPLLPEHLASGQFYKEHYDIPPASQLKIQAHKNANQPIFAIGTTTTRTLESWAKTGQAQGETDLLITPPYSFQMIDGLLTNFHVPESSLMHLVEAFLQFKGSKRHLKELYALALENDFRFYSFGDAMLLC